MTLLRICAVLNPDSSEGCGSTEILQKQQNLSISACALLPVCFDKSATSVSLRNFNDFFVDEV